MNTSSWAPARPASSPPRPCASTRRHDAITVVGDEPEAPYSRMAIPYLLTGSVDENGTLLRHGRTTSSRSASRCSRPCRRSGHAGASVVKLENGSQLPFDRLLIATGSSPATPPIPGIQGPGRAPLLDPGRRARHPTLAKPGARVLQMGAGFIGCIILEALASRGVKLTVVEMGDRMVPRMMGPTAGT
jgi:NADPH-dependent 2,4-dienoyl-CoA reductase/sulfur reductase-like enzyme